jgi:hypothetical protein
MLHLDKWNMTETLHSLSHPERAQMKLKRIAYQFNICKPAIQKEVEMKQMHYANAYKEMLDDIQKTQGTTEEKSDDLLYDEINDASAFSIE